MRSVSIPVLVSGLVMMVVGASLLSGCGGYSIRGRVVDGELPLVMLTDADDPMLERGDGVSGVSITAFRDPDRLNREAVATVRSSGDGRFALSIDAFGAGWMTEMWEIQAEAAGRQRATATMALPKRDSGKVLLIVLPEGNSLPNPRNEDLMDVYEQYR